MADPNDNIPTRVQLRVDVAKEVDRALELEAVRRDVTKRELVEIAIRQYLKLPAKRSAA